MNCYARYGLWAICIGRVYMFVLKCEYCGFEQVIKKRIDKYTYYELTHCKHLWCPCNK